MHREGTATKTKVITTSRDNPDISLIEECGIALREGKIVAFPTETVYGIGVNALDSQAVLALYQAKLRPMDKPLLCHVSSMAMAEELAVLTNEARLLISRFIPGPLTLVLKKRKALPDIVTAGGDTIGLRFPSDSIFLELSRVAGIPIAATSANISGGISPKNGAEVVQELSGRADYIINAGNTQFGTESTILSLAGDTPIILRHGAVTKQEIWRALGL